MRQLVMCVLNAKVPLQGRRRRNYGPQDVQDLSRMLARNLRVDYDFLCLTDSVVPGIQTAPLRHQWPGWWAKMELFRPDVVPGATKRPMQYIDLNTVIVGDITALVAGPHQFTMLQDFKVDRRASGLMAWRGDYSYLYDAFKADSAAAMAAYAADPKLGDQSFIEDNLRTPPERFQDRFPGMLESYKVHVRRRLLKRPGKDARMVFFHGNPGMRDVRHKWLDRAVAP